MAACANEVAKAASTTTTITPPGVNTMVKQFVLIKVVLTKIALTKSAVWLLYLNPPPLPPQGP